MVKIKFQKRTYSLDELPSQLPREGEYSLVDVLPGPMADGTSFEDAYADVLRSMGMGTTHLLFAEMQKKYGGSLTSNIVVPRLLIRRQGDSGDRVLDEKTLQVIVGDAEDAARIGRVHVEKEPNFTPTFFDSIISTTDNAQWAEQREHLITAFLPHASLSRIFPISLARAKVCAERYRALSQDGTTPVDMNDFLLHETQAQLQLALFGVDNEFQERTNERYRKAMGGEENPSFVEKFLKELQSHFVDKANACPVYVEGKPGPTTSDGCPYKGPLSNRLASMPNNTSTTSSGNALIFAFAGHDTTGHTATWVLYELAKAPHFMLQVQNEIDEFYRSLNGRDPEYQDLQRNLPFLTKVIMETLRKWPAVANGTFRRLQFDDYVKGPNGKDVLLPKGTLVQLVNWSRHRAEELWGKNVDDFDPNREFQAKEIWHGSPLKGYNPHTPRFTPWTVPPRHCIGFSFANIELRLILAELLRKYTFHLTPEYTNLDHEAEKAMSVNYGTLAPRAFFKPSTIRYASGSYLPSVRVPTGMTFTATPRQPDPFSRSNL